MHPSPLNDNLPHLILMIAIPSVGCQIRNEIIDKNAQCMFMRWRNIVAVNNIKLIMKKYMKKI